MNVIQMRRSATAGVVPTAAQLISGELALNVADGLMFFERSDGTVVQVPSYPTDWASVGSNLNIDFGSLGSPSTPVISFSSPASVGLDFGGTL